MTTNITIYPETSNLSPHQRTMPKAPDIVNDDFFGSFADVLDVINPLQHIPVVSDIYQAATGDTMGAAARIAGGALLGGPIGLIASIINVIFEQETGQGVAGTLFSAVTGKYEKTAALS